MFERFTDRARRVVMLAQDEAAGLGHNYIGTEHLLLGLVSEGEGVASLALAALEISLEDVRAQVEEIVGRSDRTPEGHIPFTPRAKKVMELSLREALQIGHNYIGTEHVLLGLIREGEGVAAQVLGNLGAELVNVRQKVLEILGRYETAKREGAEAETDRLLVAVENVRVAQRALAAAEFTNQQAKARFKTTAEHVVQARDLLASAELELRGLVVDGA